MTVFKQIIKPLKGKKPAVNYAHILIPISTVMQIVTLQLNDLSVAEISSST